MRQKNLLLWIISGILVLGMCNTLPKLNTCNFTDVNNAATNVEYFQTFDEQAHGDDPAGWTDIVSNPAAYNSFVVVQAGFNQNNMTTNSLMVRDSQGGSHVEGTYDFGAPTSSGSLEFLVELNNNYDDATDYFFILEDNTGGDLITLQFTAHPATDNWNFQLQGVTSPDSFSKPDMLVLEIYFSQTSVCLFMNGSRYLDDIAFSGGDVMKMHILSTISGYGNPLFLDNLKLSSGKTPPVEYHQTFDDETAGDNPAGWTDIVENPAGYNNFIVAAPGTGNNGLTTNSLMIRDSQAGSNVEGTYDFGAPVMGGSLEFLTVVGNSLDYENDYYVVLEDAAGADLITLHIDFMPATDDWAFHLQGVTSPDSFAHPDMLTLEIYFNQTEINLFLNGSRYLEDIAFSGGEVRKMHILTSVSGSGGGVFFDYIKLNHMKTLPPVEEPSIPPKTPTLNSLDSPDSDGSFTVSWSEVEDADTYKLYRSTTYISAINGMTPIYQGDSTTYNEVALVDGIYYYGVVATNDSGSSDLSNVETIEVSIPVPPDAATLNSFDSPDSDGSFTVSWSEVEDADTYNLYRSTSSFSDISGMTPIYQGGLTTFSEENLTEGTYYYAVVAINEDGSSDLSNLESIEVSYPSIPLVAGYNTVFLLAIGGISLLLISRLKIHKKR